MAFLRYLYIIAALSFGVLEHCYCLQLNEPPDQICLSTFSELAAQLSPDADIVSASRPEYERWQAYKPPTFSIIVEVAVEEDVQKTIRFANKHGFPFLAVDGGHGQTPSLAAMQDGIAISLVKMKAIELDDSGEVAEIGPGLINGDLIRGLLEHGKQTSTGICLCPGVTGIMLGGGVGLLQGYYGLVADQMLEARVVLADGSLVTASATEHGDLFWALRGAGHNFGIVTSLKIKVYEKFDKWSEIQMFFSGDQLEEVFELSNKYVDQPDRLPGLFVWHNYLRLPDLSDKTVIQMSLIAPGSIDEVEQYAAPFRSMALSETQYDSVPYMEIFEINLELEDGPFCVKGMYRHLSPAWLPHYNTTSLRGVYNVYNDITEKLPEIAPTSFYIIEGYSMEGASSVSVEDSAVPTRHLSLLLSPVWGYTDPAYTSEIKGATREMRKILVEGSGSDQLVAYVNYADGDETLEEVYGHEPWRLRKLRGLKEKYDPTGVFNFYVPIEG